MSFRGGTKMLDFIMAALPLILAGLALAIAAVYAAHTHEKHSKEPRDK